MAFSYYSSITIDETLCGTADSTDFPMLFYGTYTDLKTTGNGGFVQNANGYDIGFYSDSALTTALSFQLISFNATTGAVQFRVKVPTLSTSANTVIYMAFGDSGISTDQSSTAVWNSSYQSVYNLEDGSTLNLNDSTSNGRNLTNVNTVTATTGQIGGAAQFASASSKKLTSTNGMGWNPTTNSVRMTAWVNIPDTSERGAFAKVIGVHGNYDGIAFGVGSGDMDTNGNKLIALFEGTSWMDSGSSFGTGWHKASIHFLRTANGTGTATLYKDGSSVASASKALNPVAKSALFSVGGYDSVRFFNNAIDMVSVWSATTLPTASWETAEYNNESAPSTFYSVGTKVSIGGATRTDQFFRMF